MNSMKICKICNKKFNDIKELSKHLLREHFYSVPQLYDYYNFSFETKEATCPICGTRFIMTKRQIDGFKKNPEKSIGCCASCSKALIMITHGSPLANPKIYQKAKESLMKKYGVKHPAQSKEIMDRMKETTLERFGVDNVSKSKKVQEKRKRTNLERFGVEQVMSSKEIRDRAQETIREKYNVDNVFQSEEIKDKIRETNLKNLGVKYPMQSRKVQDRMRRTNLKNLGVEFPMQSEKVKENTKKTNLKRHNVEWAIQSESIREKRKNTMMENFGVEYPLQSSKVREKMKRKSLEKYGTEHPLQSSEVRNKSIKTTLERYGVPYFCQHEKCISAGGKRISKVNKKFQEFLHENGVESELEFILEGLGYDLKAGDTLIEIDPWFTHNSTVGPTFKGYTESPRLPNYHLEKSEKAKRNDYRCIHVFDWEDWNKVIYLLQHREKKYARKCEVKEISKKEAKEFLEKYHLQGSTREVKYAYGLYYEGDLLEVMTFGLPRYNKNYEYELLRLCTIPRVSVVGGANKVFKYFEEHIKPKSVISYCDLSKFDGDVYKILGFKLLNKTEPVKHWYNPKTKRHITDNLLRQRGFDQLHNANFGKGTSNEELMKAEGYVEIYDCGQLVFVKKYER